MKVFYLAVGSGNHDRRFLEKLAQRGHETYLVYFHPEGHRLTVEGIQSFYIGNGTAPAASGALAKLFRMKQVYGRFLRLLKKLKPDVLQAGWLLNAGFMAALSGFHPFILVPWGSDVLIEPERNRLFRGMVRYALSRADRLSCDAETVKKKILTLVPSYPEEHITVVPWGIDLNVFHPDAENRGRMRQRLGWEGRKILIMTRYFKPVYGVDIFLKSLPAVRCRHSNLGVLLAGSGPLETELRQLTERLGLNDVVHFTGELASRDLALALQAADLYVTTSFSDGTSVSLLEALACGLPVVTTDVPSLLEWVTERVNGRVVPCGDSNRIAQAVTEILGAPEEAHRMGQRNLEVARERADWERNFSRLESIYQEVAG